MDPVYVEGLRKAKAAVDAGTLSAEEFEKTKERLRAKREEREKEAQVRSLHSEHDNSDLGALLRMLSHLLGDAKFCSVTFCIFHFALVFLCTHQY